MAQKPTSKINHQFGGFMEACTSVYLSKCAQRILYALTQATEGEAFAGQKLLNDIKDIKEAQGQSLLSSHKQKFVDGLQILLSHVGGYSITLWEHPEAIGLPQDIKPEEILNLHFQVSDLGRSVYAFYAVKRDSEMHRLVNVKSPNVAATKLKALERVYACGSTGTAAVAL